MPNARVRGPSDAWLNIQPSELAALDAGLASGINGDDGGTWAPLSPLVFGVGGFGSNVPLVLARGGRLTTTSDLAALVQPTVTMGAGDWLVLDPSNVLRTLPLMATCANARGLPSFTWAARRENGGVQAYSPMFDLSDGFGQRASRAYLRIRAHDGATLSSLTVYFHVGFPHTALPTTMPSVRIVRVDPFGAFETLTSQAAGADANGYVYVPTPASPAAWTNQFQQQTLVVPCDQNNVIDIGSYSYLVELVEEHGLSGYPWQLTYTFAALVATTGTNLALSGLVTIDSVNVQSGDTVLVKDQTLPAQNGLYIVNSGGAWPRWNILSQGSQFSQGMVVPIANAGAINSGTFWQVASSITSWTPNNAALTPDPGTPLPFLTKPDAFLPQEGSGFFPHGILWQAVRPIYTNIADLRPF